MIRSYTDYNFPIIFPKRIGHYDCIKLLGCGLTSVVVLVEDLKTKEKFAAKIISKKDIEKRKLLDAIQNEINILKSLNHPNIIKIVESFELKGQSFEEIIIIITEYCENGTLTDYTNDSKFKNELQKKKIIRDLLSAIAYLHKQKIAHGDIKGENILLDKDLNPKLCDFGFVHRTIIAGDESRRGSIIYSAPELFLYGVKFNTLKADIYAIGVLIYTIDKGFYPFIGNERSIIFQKINGFFKIPKGRDKRLIRIFRKCININPEKRPNIEDIIKDDYFTEAILSQSFEKESYIEFENLFIPAIKAFINDMKKRKNETLLSIYEKIVLLNSFMNKENICIGNCFKKLERILHLYIQKNYNYKIFKKNRKIERDIFTDKNGSRIKKVGFVKYDFNKYDKKKPVRYIIPNEKSYQLKLFRN